MNFAGILATLIFIITVGTVVCALAAYGIFKARQRRQLRSGAARGSAPFPLEFWNEYLLPDMARAAARTMAMRAPPRRWLSPTTALAMFVGAVAVLAVGLPLVLVGTARLPGAPATSDRLERAPPHFFATLPSRKPSLFPSAGLDADGDGRLAAAERARLHATVPQFILLTSDDNGTHEGLEWMQKELAARGRWSQVTFFMTGNYLSGRPNYLGGPIDAWWLRLLREGHIGLHGLTHAEGAESWSAERWRRENATVQDEIERRLALPEGWDWARYPWGSRAPFLLLSDTYFQSLEQLRHRPIYDASLVVHPGGRRMVPPREGEPREVSWPFTLDNPVPDDLDPPYLPATDLRAVFSPHRMWEVPVYAWWIHPSGGRAQWQPSLDFNLWKFFGCDGAGPNEAIVDAMVENLRSHYEGNRAPFHIGFHASNFAAGEACKRNTAVRLFDALSDFAAANEGVRFVSIPDLLSWMEENP